MIIQRIKTLYARIIVALLVLSVLPLSVYFTITNTFIEETLVDEIQRANHEIAVHATDNINATIHHTIEKIVQATNLLELDALDVAEQEWALQSIHKLMPETIQLTIFNAQGDVVVNWMKSAVKKGYKKSDFSIHLMSNALKGKKTIGSISVSSNGQKTLDFSLPLYDPVKNKMVAVLIVKMSLEQLLPQMRTLKREGNAKIFIIDKQRRYVVHPDVSLVLSDKKIQESPLVKSYLNGNIEFQAQQYVTENDINVLAVAQYVDVINALLIVEQPADEALQTLNWIKRTLTVFCIVLFLFMLLVIYYFGMKVIKPLANLRYGAEAVGRGVFDLTLPVQSDDELSEVVTAFNKMALNLKNITQERNKELWLKDNVSLLHQNFQGEKSMSLLCQEVMNYLASISRAQLGALYIMKDTDQTLSQHASYALPMPSELAITYQSGEGLIGQVAVNKVLTRLKPSQDSFTVDAGINRVIPKDVLVLPFVFDNETQAVILLASLKLFDEKVPELLERISETVAAVVHSTRSRIKIAALLSDAQSQKEQLQLTNNNLSQKTQALNDTRIELEAQQEELKVSNEELEEKAEYLQQQQCRIEESNEQLEASRQKLAISSQYKSDFLANMSHELRSPLNSILLFSQSLAENKGDNLTDKQVEFAETIGHSGKELLTLINDILDIAKIESGKTVLTIGEYKPKSLPAYIKKMFGFQVKKKGLELVFQVDESLPEIIRTDTHRLGQIIKNFLSNAIKFTEQGEIRVSIGLQQSDQIFIAVKDSGIGIAPDKQGLVFESFQQADSSTSRKYGGTGLGLPISKELADLLGGHIELTSQLGEGCTFTLFLPTNQTEQVAEVVDVISEPILDSMVEINHQDVENVIIENTLQDDRDDILERDRSLLIVDDDEPFAKLLLDLGRQHQFKVLVALKGDDAVVLAKKYLPSAIILDVGLPGANGWQVMNALQSFEKTRHIPVHFISASNESLKAMQLGALGFLDKPVNQQELHDTFTKLSDHLHKQIRTVCLIVDDSFQYINILNQLEAGAVKIEQASQSNDVIHLLSNKQFDCIVMNNQLNDMSGLALLEKLNQLSDIKIPPIIFYSEAALTEHEIKQIQQYSNNLRLKNIDTTDRLVGEITLFLHRLEHHAESTFPKLANDESVFEQKTILVVDDDARNVYALSSILESKGLTSIKSFDGLSALEKLAENPKIDLVLMDIMMPKMDGYETMRRIRQQTAFKTLPMIALTAKAMNGDRQKCIDAGANDYLTKPLDTDQLLSLMRVWLAK